MGPEGRVNQSQDFENNFNLKNNSNSDTDLKSDLQSDIQGEVEVENPPAEINPANPIQDQSTPTQQVPVNNIQSKVQPEQNMSTIEGLNSNMVMPIAPTVSKKRIWLWIIIGFFVFLLLSLGGLVFASYKGWVNIGLTEYFGGVSGNPYKALYQVANTSTDIKVFEYSSDFRLTTRMDSAQIGTSNSQIQESISDEIISTVSKVLSFPNSTSLNPLSEKILGETTSKTATDFEFQVSGKYLDKTTSAQYRFKLPSDTSTGLYNQYLEPFANSDDQIVLDEVLNLEDNNMYLKISSIPTDQNPWVKLTIPESYLPENKSTQDVLKDQLKEFKGIELEEFQDLFKEADNLGIETIDGNMAYHFSYLTDIKTIYEFVGKFNNTKGVFSDSYEQDNFDLNFDVWLGVFDQLVYKFDFDFTTKETNLGSVQFDSSLNFKYQDISIEIPEDSECVGSICDSAIADIGFVADICQNTFYRDALDSLSSDIENNNSTDSAQARDSIRKSDLRSFQTVLESYYDQNGNYPISVTASKTNDKEGVIYKILIKDLEKVSVDPSDPDWYYAYKSNADGTEYELTCILEAPTNAEELDKVGTVYLYKVGTGGI